jgi:hypothetical protein
VSNELAARLYAVARCEYVEGGDYRPIALVAGPFLDEGTADAARKNFSSDRYDPEFRVVSSNAPIRWGAP